MRRFWAIAVASAALAGCQNQAEPSVESAWVRLPAASGRPGAAYFTLHGGKAPMTLVSIATPAAGRTELHQTIAGDGGMMSMAPLARVDVPAGGEVKFAPGGKHLMLFDLSPRVQAGQQVPFTFVFADGKRIGANARVVGAGDPAP